MAIKIYELLQTIGSGARTNKYRLMFPFMGRDFDIQCQEVTSPGRSMGSVEIFLRGRKFLLAGDRSDEGSVQITFYNEPGLGTRNFFLAMIDDIQSYLLGNSQDKEPNWYMFDMTIHQLDNEEISSSSIILYDAWVSEVSEIQYTDETGEISKTTITIMYSGNEVL